jgi:polyvinyl alcohol dehydrogenase (cytochrome)
VRLTHRVCLGFLLTLCSSQLALGQSSGGSELYTAQCASCHDGGADRAPTLEALRSMSASRVLDSMEIGSMISMAHGRTAAERRAIAEFVSGKSFDSPLVTTPSPSAMCSAGTGFADPLSGPIWNGWGQNELNRRFQEATAAGITAEQVPRLKLKWVFGFPGDIQAMAQATLVGGRVFVGSIAGNVYSLNASTGCVHWHFQAETTVRSAVSVGRVQSERGTIHAAFFGDARGNAYGVEAATGRLLWKTRVESFPTARITGSPVFHNGRLYVPVASSEEGAGSLPAYECCRFRGSIVALDAASGAQIWKTYTIAEEPRPTRKNRIGTQLWGPSGAPVWSSPAVDVKRNALYVTTGDNYSDPATGTSDAFMAMDLDSGKVLWVRQTTADDAYVSACRLPDKTNCPEAKGPDFDFAASPILVSLADGRRALIAGQKSGVVHALDPDRNGEVLWQVRLSEGGTMGGIQWGSAVDDRNIYVALSDLGRVMLTFSQFTDADPKRGGGMFALRLESGERVWHTPPVPCGNRQRCSPAQSAAVSAIPGVAFSGSYDGHLRAYSTIDGRVLWDFDTVRTYETVNGVPARGGSLDGPGPAIGGGMLYVSSGYTVGGGMSGNVLLAFSVDGK